MQVKSFFSLNSLEKSDFGKKLKNRYAVSRYAVTGFTNNPQREICNHLLEGKKLVKRFKLQQK